MLQATVYQLTVLYLFIYFILFILFSEQQNLTLMASHILIFGIQHVRVAVFILMLYNLGTCREITIY